MVSIQRLCVDSQNGNLSMQKDMYVAEEGVLVSLLSKME